MARNKPTVKVKIISDTMCPWCFVGKRHLENAIKNFQSTFDFNIEWKPFLLQAEAPEKGVPVLQYLADKYGQKVADDAKSGKSSLYEAGRRVGIIFNVNRVFVNSIRSHCLLDYAKVEGKQNDLAEVLFQHYFVVGENINDVNVLLSCAEQVGLNLEAASTSLQDKSRRDEILREANWAIQNNIHGVPHFTISLVDDNVGKIFNLHGCQPVQAFHSIFTSIQGRI